MIGQLEAMAIAAAILVVAWAAEAWLERDDPRRRYPAIQREHPSMSYSFSVKAANKAAAKAAVAEKFAEVIASQPIHARDRAAALANAGAAIDALVDDDALHVAVNLSGSVGWRDQLSAAGDNPLTSVSISASASLFKPE